MSEITITYYEDEINDSVFKKNECDNYIQLMEKYLKESIIHREEKARGRRITTRIAAFFLFVLIIGN